jgi:hypothetical protein
MKPQYYPNHSNSPLNHNEIIIGARNFLRVPFDSLINQKDALRRILDLRLDIDPDSVGTLVVECPWDIKEASLRKGDDQVRYYPVRVRHKAIKQLRDFTDLHAFPNLEEVFIELRFDSTRIKGKYSHKVDELKWGMEQQLRVAWASSIQENLVAWLRSVRDYSSVIWMWLKSFPTRCMGLDVAWEASRVLRGLVPMAAPNQCPGWRA